MFPGDAWDVNSQSDFKWSVSANRVQIIYCTLCISRFQFFSSDILKCGVSPRSRDHDITLATARFITYLYKSPLPMIVRKQNCLHRGSVASHCVLSFVQFTVRTTLILYLESYLIVTRTLRDNVSILFRFELLKILLLVNI